MFVNPVFIEADPRHLLRWCKLSHYVDVQ